MFSGEFFGRFPFSGSDIAALDDPDFAEFLRLVSAERCWLLEIDALSLAPGTGARIGAFSGAGFSQLAFGRSEAGEGGGVVTLRFGTKGYTSRAEDAPASTYYQPRLSGDIQISRGIIGRDGIGGLAGCVAQVKAINTDGGLDNLADDYAFDGRSARLLVGDPDGPLADFWPVFRGVVARNPVVNLSDATFYLSDGLAKLDRPIQETLYEGSGGLEGGADLRGKPKPDGWGGALNIAPPLVDGVNLVYQVRAGAVQAIEAVYDRGVALTPVVGTPALGEYSKDLAAGTFALGGQAAGTVTADAKLDAGGSGYIDRLGDIVLRILTERAALSSSEIDPGSFVAINDMAPAPVGFAIMDGSPAIKAVLDELLWASGAFGGFNRLGAFAVGQIAAPDGEPVLVLDEADIIDLQREPLPESLEPTVWRVRVGYARNWTVQTDLAASVPPDRVQFAAQPLRFTEPAEDTARHSRHRLAKELEVGGYFEEEADAEQERDRQAALWGGDLSAWRITVPLFGMRADMGSVVEVRHSRVKRGDPTLARVLGYEIKRNTVELRVLL